MLAGYGKIDQVDLDLQLFMGDLRRKATLAGGGCARKAVRRSQRLRRRLVAPCAQVLAFLYNVLACLESRQAVPSITS